MVDKWKDITGFLGYQVSDQGQVRTFWRKKHYPTGYGTYRVLSSTPTIMSQSDDGNGYMKIMLYKYNDGKRYCKKVHRLVAEAFIPNKYSEDYTVDHIQSGAEGKLNNSVNNLRWISRADNIKKAYEDGVCDERIRKQNKGIIAKDLWAGDERYFSSIKEASRVLNLDHSSISHVLIGDNERTSRYIFEYAGKEEKLLYGENN